MISGASRVIVATDSEKIKNAISTHNADCIMTSGDHPNGSNRICEALEKAGADSNQVIVNLQGDEPLISPDTVRHLAILKANCVEDVTTVVSKFESAEEIVNPNCVKVVTTHCDQALYFSRAMIPFDRDASNPWKGYRSLSKAYWNILILCWVFESIRRKWRMQFGKLENSNNLGGFGWKNQSFATIFQTGSIHRGFKY